MAPPHPRRRWRRYRRARRTAGRAGLLTLPPEVRRLIWAAAYPHRTLYICTPARALALWELSDAARSHIAARALSRVLPLFQLNRTLRAEALACLLARVELRLLAALPAAESARVLESLGAVALRHVRALAVERLAFDGGDMAPLLPTELFTSAFRARTLDLVAELARQTGGGSDESGGGGGGGGGIRTVTLYCSARRLGGLDTRERVYLGDAFTRCAAAPGLKSFSVVVADGLDGSVGDEDVTPEDLEMLGMLEARAVRRRLGQGGYGPAEGDWDDVDWEEAEAARGRRELVSHFQSLGLVAQVGPGRRFRQ